MEGGVGAFTAELAAAMAALGHEVHVITDRRARPEDAQRDPAAVPRCVVNMADSESGAADIGAGLQQLSTAFLGAQIDFLGYIPFNRTVRTAATRQTPLVLAHPTSPASAAITRIVNQLSDRPSSPRPRNGGGMLDDILRRREPLQEVWATP